MPRIDGETLRSWRRSRGWDVPEMARQLRRAAGSGQMPAHDSLIRQIRGWEHGDHEISERYELLYMTLGASGRQDVPDDEDEPVRRHDFLTLTGTAAAGLVAGSITGDLGTVRQAAPRGLVDESAVSALTAITGAQRKLEATTPARDLTESTLAHAGTARRMLERAGDASIAAGVAAALSEACGLAAWLHADMADTGSARNCYRLAVQAAHRARSGLLSAYMLGSLAAFEADSGVAAIGMPLLEEAGRQIRLTAPHPTPLAWLHAIEALTLAGTPGNGDAAWRALGRAEQVLETGGDTAAPPWPWVFIFDHRKLAGYRARVAVQLGRPAAAFAAFSEALPSASAAPKQQAIITLDVATATCQEGCATKDAGQVEHAFTLASDALTAGVTFGSGRVVERSWRFRRSYAGPVRGYVRDFDEQLRIAVA
jgi:hypothetical protein